MSIKDRDAAYFWDMLQAATEVHQMVSDIGVDEFCNSIILCRATERCLEIIGESAKRISDPGKKNNPDIPWQDIIGQRNIIAHEYGQIDYELLYTTVTDDIPVLIYTLQAILAKIKN
jgi:uncharacterized protein with HEPN domain